RREGRGFMIEREQPLVGQRKEELDYEERVAASLLVHQLRERRGLRQLAVKRVRNELTHVLTGEGRESDLLHGRSRVPDRLQLVRQRMGGADLVVAVGADQQEVLLIRPGQQVLEQVERRRVEPLQVVEEQREWMFRPGEDPDEPPKHQLETPLRIQWRKLGDRWLVSDDELELGDDVDHEPSVRA